MGLVFGTAPDSWGVWHVDHPSQPPWERFLDEAATAGYELIELGPFGYLPTDPARLGEELAARGLGLIAGTLISDLHRPELRPELRQRTAAIASLVAALGGRFLVVMGDLYREEGGRPLGPTDLDLAGWRALIETTDELGRLARDDHGIELVFHPHADTVVEYSRQVDRFLDDVDADAVALCLDTGHLEYRDGDSVRLMQERFDRIHYLHLKSLDPALKARVAAEDLDFPTAVRLGVMCEPDVGTVDFAGMARVMREVAWDGFAIVEQDMFPLDDPARPLPVATRTRHHFEGLGWSTSRGSA